MDEQYIGIRFSEHDHELLAAIRREFPDCQLIHSDELEGADVFFVAIIPLAAFGLQLWDFILNHFSKKSDSDSSAPVEEQRELINDGNSVTKTDLVDKSPEEIKHTLNLKFNFEISWGSKHG